MKCARYWSSCSMGLALLAVATPALLPAQGKRVAAPTGVTVTSDASALTVSWNNMANVVSYTVNRRSPEQALGTAAASPYSGALPQAGVFYEYQVVSVGQGKNNIAASQWVAYTVPNAPTQGVIVTEPRPPRGTITPIPAGPSSLTARSGIPGVIQLTCREVAGATGYRILRSSTAPEVEARIAELSSTSQLAEGGMWSHTDAPVDLRWTYSYKVYALFGSTLSTPSPVATTQSMPVVHPTDLRYTVTLTPTPGVVNVTLSWSGVPNVVHYVVLGSFLTAAGYPNGFTTTSTSYTRSNVMAGGTGQVCVAAVYQHAGDESTAPCIEVKLR